MVDPSSAGLIAAGVALTPLATKLLVRTLGPAADAVGEHFAEKVTHYFERNRNRAVNRAAEMVAASGRETREVPIRTALPLLEGASREDDPELSEQWAALLANAATADDENAIPPLFPTILSQLTPIAAEVLRVLDVHTQPPRVLTRATELGLASKPHGLAALTVHDISERLEHDRGIQTRYSLAIEINVDVLISQGLAAREWHETDGASLPGFEEIDPFIRITELGRRFLQAVQPPARSPAV